MKLSGLIQNLIRNNIKLTKVVYHTYIVTKKDNSKHV